MGVFEWIAYHHIQVKEMTYFTPSAVKHVSAGIFVYFRHVVSVSLFVLVSQHLAGDVASTMLAEFISPPF